MRLSYFWFSSGQRYHAGGFNLGQIPRPHNAPGRARIRCQRRFLYRACHARGQSPSSQNATRRGLLADSTVFDGESEERFCAFLAALEAELQPEPGIEASQVEVMAVAHWRRMRLLSVEKVQYYEETAKCLATLRRQGDPGSDPPITQLTRSFRSLSDESRSIELLNRYESRYSREYQRALACFKSHRADKQRERAETAARKIGETR
jgi:hypothetical protein